MYFSFSSTQQVTRTLRRNIPGHQEPIWEILKAPLREGRILIVARLISYFFFPFLRDFLQACILLSGDREPPNGKDVSARSLRRFKENNPSKISPSTASRAIVNDVTEKHVACSKNILIFYRWFPGDFFPSRQNFTPEGWIDPRFWTRANRSIQAWGGVDLRRRWFSRVAYLKGGSSRTGSSTCVKAMRLARSSQGRISTRSPSKTDAVGRRVLGECIAFSCFGRRPASGDASREIEEIKKKNRKIRRGRAIEEKQGRKWAFCSSIINTDVNCESALDPFEYLIGCYHVFHIFVFSFFPLSFPSPHDNKLLDVQ